MQTLFDPIRKAHVKKTPEEVIRQQFIQYLIQEKHFPQQCITVEKAISQFPFASGDGGKLPLRRLDILCLDASLTRPLLVAECKAGQINAFMMQQVHGYNAFIKAPFVALVGCKDLFFSYFNSEKGEYETIDWMPTYEQLQQKNHG